MTTEGKTVAKADFHGKYLLVYHWGLCPGSIAIDKHVRGLYDEYQAQGFEVLGLTESIATIRQLYEQLPEDKETPGTGQEDIRSKLGGMLKHDWTEAELETNHPENQSWRPFRSAVGRSSSSSGRTERYWREISTTLFRMPSIY